MEHAGKCMQEAATHTGDPERAKGRGLVSKLGIVPLTFFLQAGNRWLSLQINPT